jgi:peptidyl-prolyl cis-trans isomerase C
MRRVLPLLLLLTACAEQKPAPPPGDFAFSGTVISTVNGNPITQGMLDATVKQLPPQMREQLEQSNQMGQVKERLIVGDLLYREALTRKLHEKPEVQELLALAQRTALADAALEAVTAERVTDAAIQQWYTDHAVQFAQPQAFVRHILVEDEAAAADIVAQARAGADFAALAASRSKDAGSAAKGGELGWISQKQILPDLAGPIFATEKGAVTDPVKTRFGFHVMKVEDKRETVPLEEVKDQIRDQVKQDAVSAYIKEIRAAATVSEGAGGASLSTEGGAPGAPAMPAAPATPAAPAPGGQ